MAVRIEQDRIIDERLALAPDYIESGIAFELPLAGSGLTNAATELQRARQSYGEAVARALGTLARAEALFKKFNEIPGL